MSEAATVDKSKFSRKTLKKLFRKALSKKIHEDRDFAKTFFEEKSKRSTERKVAYRRRHVAKK
ncbi:MAG: hypothetical protein CL678_04645 [Bdellovibrionaceae bacterium]|nr:hypothetical protein [Pseudobdellovibrionaceae bacterium]|tara:strand:- start:4180 stop:4368 length:189 start_codon:yes stop_codon:yes gene_type:complete